nr:Uncharacterised protein [Raoultella sp. NCTC 9187]
MHDWQHGGHGILGKQLLAGHDNDDKTEGVAEIFQQIPACDVGKMHVKNAFCYQRGTHRQARSDR